MEIKKIVMMCVGAIRRVGSRKTGTWVVEQKEC